MHKLLSSSLFKEIIRYLLVGGLAFLGESLVLIIFEDYVFTTLIQWWVINVGLTIATTLGFITGLTINYLLSLTFVFKHYENPDAKRIKGLIQFASIGIIGLVIKALGMNLFDALNVYYLIGHIIMTIIVLAWNYIGRKLIIFKGDRHE